MFRYSFKTIRNNLQKSALADPGGGVPEGSIRFDSGIRLTNVGPDFFLKRI